jgi:branched-chain amino acid transport system permease protein
MDFQTGFDLSLLGFLAVVIGGLASVWGSLVGGLLLGLLQSTGAWLIGARWFDYLLVAVVVLAFRLRPQGLFATSVRDWD